MKKTTTLINDATVDAAAYTITQLLDVAQGDDSYMRNGLKITPKYMAFKFVWYSHYAAGSTTPNFLRVVIFQDTQQGQTAPIQDQLFVAQNGTGTVATNLLSFLNPDNAGRFKIWHDKIYVSHPSFSSQTAGTTTAIGCTGVVEQKKYIRFKGKRKYLPMWFGSAATDIVNNQFYIAYINTIDESSTFSIMWRLGYTDT